MWTMTTAGFFSAVQHRDDPTLLVVRTRDRGDADRLCEWYALWAQQLVDLRLRLGQEHVPDLPDAAVTAYERSDYPWRVIMPRAAYGAFMAEAVEDLDYGNFKDAVKANQGEGRAGVYMGVWSTLLRLEDLDPEGRPAPEVPDWVDSEDEAPWDDEDALVRYYADRGWLDR